MAKLKKTATESPLLKTSGQTDAQRSVSQGMGCQFSLRVVPRRGGARGDGVCPAPEGWHSVAGGKTCPDTLTPNLELMGFSVRPSEPGVSYYLGWRGTEMVTNRTS